MESLKVTWKGVTPLIMHSCKCVNPLHPLALEMKKYTSKRKKTDEDLVALSDLEWEAGAYWDDEIGLYIPSENIEATMISGAKNYKKGNDFKKYVSVVEINVPFDYGENLTKEQLIHNYEYRDTRAVNVMRSKVIRTRPRFDRWQIQFTLQYDENHIDLETIVMCLEYAGQYVGLCDYRPKYGKFVTVIENA